LDRLLGGLSIGDNVVWETDAGAYVDLFVESFERHSLSTGHSLIYVSFNRSPMTIAEKLSALPDQKNITLLDCFTAGKGDNDPTFTRFYDSGNMRREMNVIKIDNPSDVSQFVKILNKVEEEKGAGARYVFDSVTGMQDLWGDETKTYKFFTYSCPRLYDLDTVAYWILERAAHTPSFRANLEHVTQVALEISHTNDQLFLRLIKAENRHSTNMLKAQEFEVWHNNIVFREAPKKEILNLGGKVKSLRLKSGLTQSQLAKKINVTASYISQLERNLVSPSIDSLVMLSSELQVEPGFFFSLDRPDLRRIIHRNYRRKAVTLAGVKDDAARCELLVASTDNRRIQPMLMTIEPNSEFPGHFLNHKGDEFILVLKGELQLDLDDRSYLLQEGDSIYLDSIMPTAWRNAGKHQFKPFGCYAPDDLAAQSSQDFPVQITYVPVHRRDPAIDLHHQSHRKLQSPVTKGNQEQKPVSHRRNGIEAALSGNTGSCEEMDYEAAELVRDPGSVIHPFRRKDSGVSMKVGRRLFTQNY